MINIIFFAISFLLGMSMIIVIIRNDIKKKKFTDFIPGMYLQLYSGPDKITENRGIQFLIKVKEQYPDVNIDVMIIILRDEGFIVK